MQIMAFTFLFKGCLHLKSHTGYCLRINSRLSLFLFHLPLSPLQLSSAFETEQNTANLAGAILLLVAFSCFSLIAGWADQVLNGEAESISAHMKCREIMLGQSPSTWYIQSKFTVIDSYSEEACCVCLQTGMQYLQVCGFIDIFLSFPVVFNWNPHCSAELLEVREQKFCIQFSI